MSLEKIASNEGPIWADVDKAGAAVEIDPHECRRIVALLEDEKLVISEPMPDGRIHVRLTLKGYDEVEKLHRPPWRRWLDHHKEEAWLTWAGAITIAVVVQLVRHFFP